MESLFTRHIVLSHDRKMMLITTVTFGHP